MPYLFGLNSPLWESYDLLKEGVLLLDHEFRLLYSNVAANQLFGLSPEQDSNSVKKKVLTEPPLDSAEFLAILQQGNGIHSGPATIKNGAGKNKGATFFCIGIADDVTGEQYGKLIFLMDNSKPTALEKTFFKQKAALLNALNGCTTEIVFVVNLLQNRTVFVNHVVHEILGWNPSDYYQGGWPFAISIVHPDDLERTRKLHDEFLNRVNSKKEQAELAAYTYTTRIRNSLGDYLKLHFTCSVLETDKDKNAVLLLYFVKPEHDSPLKLTPREVEIAKLLVLGQSSKMIAARFSLSIHTVNGYRSQLMKKSGTTNTAALVNYLIEKRLL